MCQQWSGLSYLAVIQLSLHAAQPRPSLNPLVGHGLATFLLAATFCTAIAAVAVRPPQYASNFKGYNLHAPSITRLAVHMLQAQIHTQLALPHG